MMTRHERRKAAKVKAQAKTESLIVAAIADRNARIVRNNLSSPVRPSLTPRGMVSNTWSGLNGARASHGWQKTRTVVKEKI